MMDNENISPISIMSTGIRLNHCYTRVGGLLREARKCQSEAVCGRRGIKSSGRPRLCWVSLQPSQWLFAVPRC